MNSTILTGLLSLVIGIAAGWLLKPSHPDRARDAASNAPGELAAHREPGGAAPSTDPARNRGTAPSPNSKSSIRTGTAARNNTPWNSVAGDNEELMRRAQKEAITALEKSQEAQLQKLVAELNLTPAQQQELKEQFYDLAVEQARFWNRAGADVSIVSPSRPPNLGEVLGEILDAGQAEAYEALRDRNQRIRREARTLHLLAELSFLELTPDQRDAAYDVLYQNGETGADPGISHVQFGSPSIVTYEARVASGGGENSPALESTAIFSTVIGSSTTGTIIAANSDSPEAVEQRRVMIEQEADRFWAIFTQEQMASYRQHLESRYSGSGFHFGGNAQLPPLVK